MTQNPWTNIRRSFWWISVEDFSVFLHVSYNENEGSYFPAWLMVWCPVLAGAWQLREEVGGDPALREGLRWDLVGKGWMATSTSANWTVPRYNVPHRSLCLCSLEVPLSKQRNFLEQLDISSLVPQTPFPLTTRFSWKSAIHKKQLRLWKRSLTETQGKATVDFGDMVALHFLTGIYQWLQYYW